MAFCGGVETCGLLSWVFFQGFESRGGGVQKKVFGQGGQATHLINQGGSVVISWERGLEGGYFL